MKHTTQKTLRSPRAGAVRALVVGTLCATALATASAFTQPKLETSPAYDRAAAPLRQANKKSYDFDRASVRDVLRFLADDAGIDFVALPERGEDNGSLITFSLNMSPFSALETIAKMNGVSLVFEDQVFHMRPLDDKTLIARTYRVRFNTAEMVTSSGGGLSGGGGMGGGGGIGGGGSTAGGGYGGGGGGGYGGGASGGGGMGGIGGGGSSVFETSADELIEDIKSIIGIQTSGMNLAYAPGDNAVGQFGPLPVGTSGLAGQANAPTVGGTGNAAGSSGGGGQVIWNSDTNSLFIIATRMQHQLVEKYLEMMDRPQPLIAVEVKFFETTKDPRRQLGVDWSGTMEGGYDLNLSPMVTEVNLARLGDTQLPMTSILSAPDVNVSIEALVKDRETTTVSYPRVLTRNNREVSIQSVVNQPVLSASSSTTPGVGGTTTSSVSYLPIGTSINILPKHLENGMVSLQVLITVSSIVGSEIIDGNPYPVASSRVFTAELEVENGWTLAIGGLDEATDAREGTGLPLLSKIPIIKHGFKNNTESHSRKNMLIYITPTMLDQHSGGLNKKPISEVPLRGTKDGTAVPRVRPDGSLVGGKAALGDAIKWLEEEFTLVDQIVREKRGLKEHREQIDKLVNTVNMLQRQVKLFMEQYPSDLERLEIQEWSLQHLESKMRETRRELYKRHYQLFSRPLTRFSS